MKEQISLRTMKTVLVCIAIYGACIACNAPTLRAQVFGEAEDKGVIDNDSVNEASGLVASRKNAGILWTHNDSGDEARLFAMTTSGRVVVSLRLKNALNRDWEDICIGGGPQSGVSYLYIGDIGDNDAQYPQKYIYRLAEPAIDSSQAYTIKQAEVVEKISYVYPDGQRDAETLMIDPLSNDLYIVSKREDSVRVYRLAYPQSTTQVITAQKVAQLPLTSIVAGDISPDGKEILLKNYQNVYYFRRAGQQSIADALVQGGESAPYTFEPQGEAVCFAANGEGYYTTSEETQFDIPAHVYFYPRLAVTQREEEERERSTNAEIDAIYPNPSRTEFTIAFRIKESSTITIDVVDMRGNSIRLVAARSYTHGRYTLHLPVSALSAGEYTVLLQSAGTSVSKQFIVVK